MKLACESAFTAAVVAILALSFTSSAVGADETEEPVPQCGQLCIHHCCRLLGIPVEMKDVMALMPPREEGNNMLELSQALSKIGFQVEGRLMPFEELCRGPFPIIAHMKDHFVVVESVDEELLRLLDGYGRRRIKTSEGFQQEWDGKVLKVELPADGRPLPAYLGEVPEGQPRVRFETLFLDLGEIEEGETSVDFTYNFNNVGSGGLVIEKVRTDCTCAVGDLPKAPVPPGASRTLTVRYNKGKHSGPFYHSAYVESNDPQFPVVKLSLAGNALQRLRISPQAVRFGQVAQGTNAFRRVFVVYTGDTPLKLGNTSSSVKGVEVRPTPLSHELVRKLWPHVAKPMNASYENTYVVDIDLDAREQSLGKLEGKLEIGTNLERFPVISVPIEVEIVEPVEVRPAFLFLGELSERVRGHGSLMLVSRDGTPFRVVSVESNPASLMCKYPDSYRQAMELRFTVEPNDLCGDDTVEITIQEISATKTKLQTLKVPVYSYRKPSE